MDVDLKRIRVICESEARIAMLTVQEIRKIRLENKRDSQMQTELCDVTLGLEVYSGSKKGIVKDEKCYWSEQVQTLPVQFTDESRGKMPGVD